MSIRMSARFNNKPIEDLIGYMESYQQIANEEMNNAIEVIEPQALAYLGQEPGTVKKPIQWTPAADQSKTPNVHYNGQSYYSKQKAAFFATDGFGKGIGAGRTHELAKSWAIEKNTAGQDIVIRFNNPTPYAKFVYGSLSKTNPGRFMQQFHRNTGWQEAADTVNFWMEALAEQFVDNMRQRLGELAGGTTVKTRAYTGARR